MNSYLEPPENPRRRADHRRAADGAIPVRHALARLPAAHRAHPPLLRRRRPRARRDQRRPGDRRPAHQPLDGRLGHAPGAHPHHRRLRRRASLTIALRRRCPSPGYMVVGFVAGLSYPPIQPAVRTIYPKMVNSRQLTPLFSLDASAQEIIWVAGPVDHDLRRHPDLARSLGDPARRSSSWSAAAPGSSPRPRSGGCASRAASAGSASCSPGRRCCCDDRRLPAGRRVRRDRGRRGRDLRRGRRRSPASCSRSSPIGSLVGGLALRAPADRPVGAGPADVRGLRRHGARDRSSLEFWWLVAHPGHRRASASRPRSP